MENIHFDIRMKRAKRSNKRVQHYAKNFFFSIAELKEKAVVDLLVSTLRSRWFPMIFSLLYFFLFTLDIMNEK